MPWIGCIGRSRLQPERGKAMLWTVMPPEAIFGAGEAEASGSRYRPLGEGRFLATATTPGEERIERLISTDPADFLDPRFLPGSTWRS